jgi:hypothetical protein
MISQIYTNGCSWTEGHFLHEDPVVSQYVIDAGYKIQRNKEIDFLEIANPNGQGLEYPYRFIYDKFNWAGHVAKHVDAKLINDGLGAASNSRMIRTTLDFINNSSQEDLESTLVILQWTLLERDELFLNDGESNAQWVRFNPTQRFSDLERCFAPGFVNIVDKFWELHTAYIHNFEHKLMKYFQDIYLMHNLLKAKNIKHYFFNAFPIGFGAPETFNLDFSKWFDIYAKEIEPTALNCFDTFSEFVYNTQSETNQTLIISDGHPNALGHKLWADHIIADMTAKNII